MASSAWRRAPKRRTLRTVGDCSRRRCSRPRAAPSACDDGRDARMGEHPGSYEEAELDLGLFSVSRVHVDDAARESTAAMGDAAVTQQRPDELVQKRRLA